MESQWFSKMNCPNTLGAARAVFKVILLFGSAVMIPMPMVM
jgi:hypothetical protein